MIRPKANNAHLHKRSNCGSKTLFRVNTIYANGNSNREFLCICSETVASRYLVGADEGDSRWMWMRGMADRNGQGGWWVDHMLQS